MNAKPLDPANPGHLLFLPSLYMMWSDMVLTPTEIATFKGVIAKQSWLNNQDRARLEYFLDPSLDLTPDELREWLNIIRSAPIPDGERMAETGLRLARRVSPDFLPPEKDIAALLDLENLLGLPVNESRFLFMPEERRAITHGHETKASFDPAIMQSILEGDQAETIRKVKAVISDSSFAYPDSGDLTILREQTLVWAKKLADHGFGAMAYPTEYGGGNDLAAYFTIMETLSYHDLSLVVKFGVQFGLWGMSVYLLGTEKHHRQYLRDIGTLALPGCFAMTETGHGSNVRGIETTATYDHSTRTFTIHTPNEAAQKEYIGNAALHGTMATVFAKIIIGGKDYGVGAFVVPLRNEQHKLLPGIYIKDCGRKLGLNGVDNGVIRFTNVRIPADQMLDRFASVSEDGTFQSPIASDNRRFFTMLGALVGGRIGIPRSGVAATRSGLAIAIRYGDRRRQFGPEGAAEVPILNYRTHQRRLIPRLATTYALHFALQHLTKRYINRREEEMQEIEALAAGLKAIATWHTTDTLQECREACGGKGFLWENRIGILKNDSDIYTTFEGDNTVLLQLVAKSRLTEFRQEFSHMGVLGILNFVAEQALTSITEMNPIAVRNTDDAHLLDPEFHREAFHYRQRDILISAAKRLKRLIGEGMDSFDAFNVCQHHLIETGTAYIEHIILREFRNAIETVTDEGCRSALKRLCDVYALSKLEEHKGWYLEQGYMEGVKTKAIRKTLNQLCWEVRQDAVPLVDAFGIPESCLHAPIARL